MYYEIDEKAARQAKEMCSFSAYQEGSATAKYRQLVDAAAALVSNKKAKVSEFYHGRLDSLLDSYARILADAINRENEISCRCPSVLVAGSANFPVRKKEKQVAAWDSNRENFRKADGILDKIRSTGTGPIDFADPHAEEFLADRVQQLQQCLDNAKATNAYYRKNKTLVGCPGITPDRAQHLDGILEENKKQFGSAQPFPGYELTSIRNRLHAAEDRLQEFQSRKAAPAGDTVFPGGVIVRNLDLDRLQIFFDEKPDEEQRAALKSNGFRWSPKNSAWQRQLTDSAERAARRALGL